MLLENDTKDTVVDENTDIEKKKNSPESEFVDKPTQLMMNPKLL